MIIAADGDTPFIVDLDRNPPTLDFTPHNEVAYKGNKQKLAPLAIAKWLRVKTNVSRRSCYGCKLGACDQARQC